MRARKRNPLKKLGFKVRWKNGKQKKQSALQSSCGHSGCNCSTG